MNLPFFFATFFLISNDTAINVRAHHCHNLVSINQQYSDRLIDDIMDNIVFSHMKKKGFNKIYTNNSKKTVKFSKLGTNLTFFIGNDKPILENAYILSNYIFDNNFKIIDMHTKEFSKKYNIKVSNNIVDVVNADGFVQVKIVFTNDKIIRIETVSRID